MHVGELKQLIKDLPDSMEVFIDERVTEFTYGLLNTVTVKQINFKEDPDGETLSQEVVVVLGEE